MISLSESRRASRASISELATLNVAFLLLLAIVIMNGDHLGIEELSSEDYKVETQQSDREKVVIRRDGEMIFDGRTIQDKSVLLQKLNQKFATSVIIVVDRNHDALALIELINSLNIANVKHRIQVQF